MMRVGGSSNSLTVLPNATVAALQDLYTSTGGTHWTWRPPSQGEVWNFTAAVVDPCDGWQGVVCSNYTGYIYSLTLVNYNLTGTLPLSISNLTGIEYLDLGTNFIAGRVPLDVCNLTSLVSLSLRRNQLTGTLQPCYHSSWPQLQYLSLSANMLHGSIPAFLAGAMNNLSYLSYSENVLTASLPASLQHLTALSSLYLGNNYLDGNISSTAQCRQLVDLALNSNALSGALPMALAQLSNLRYMYLHNNMLSQSIPAALGNLTDVVTFTIYNNSLTGALPAVLDRWQQLLVFDADQNRMWGTLPPFSWPSIQQIALYSNMFSGSLPSSLAGLAALNCILVHSNMLTGDPSLAFNSSLQLNLQVIDISDNAFVGRMSASFFNPNLQSFLSYGICLDGGVSEAICSSPLITTLILDGLHSHSSCAHDIWPFTSVGPKYSRAVPGSLPDCMWTDMPLLGTLHASGNGLHGSIPDLPSYQLLSDMDLSFNQLTGTLPANLQRHSILTNLDLQNNRLNGFIEDLGSLNYSSSSDGGGVSLSLSTNRLSGHIPVQLENARNIEILSGNLFACSSSHPIPKYDSDSSSYVCGSGLVDVSVATFGAIAAVMLLCLCYLCALIVRLLKNKNNSRDKLLGSFSMLSDLWRSVQDTVQTARNHDRLLDLFAAMDLVDNRPDTSRLHNQFVRFKKFIFQLLIWYTKLYKVVAEDEEGRLPHFSQFLSSLHSLRRLSILLTLLISIFGEAIFGILKLWFRTYSSQYRWSLSAVFLSGNVPAAVLIAIWMTLLMLTLFVITNDIPAPEEVLGSPSTSTHNAVAGLPLLRLWQTLLKCLQRRSFWMSLLAFSSNVLVVGGMKAGFIYFLISGTTYSTKLAMEVLISILDVSWNAIVAPFLINNLPGKSATGKMLLKVQMLFFNSVVSPCLAIMVIDSACFYGAFVPQEPVNNSFSFTACLSYSGPNNSCSNYGDWFIWNESVPQFVYNWGCSSSVISEYVPVFFFSFCFLLVSVPGISITAITRTTRWRIFSSLPGIYWPYSGTSNQPPLGMQDFYARDSGRSERFSSTTRLSSMADMVGSRRRSMHHSFAERPSDCVSPQDPASENAQPINDHISARRLLFPGFILASCTHYLLVILTFGIMFPPLALCVCALLCSTSLTWEVLIGRYIFIQEKLLAIEGNVTVAAKPAVHLNELCLKVCCSPRKCLGLLAIGSGAFAALVVYDMTGDEVGWLVGLWAPVLTMALAGALLTYFERQAERNQPRDTLDSIDVAVVVNPIRTSKNEHNSEDGGDETRRRSSLLEMKGFPAI